MGFSYAGAALGMGLAGFAKGQSEMYEKKKELEYKEKQKALLTAQADALSAAAVEKQLTLTPGSPVPTPGLPYSVNFTTSTVLQDMEAAQKQKATPTPTSTTAPAATSPVTPAATPTPVDTTVKSGIGKNLDPEQIAAASASGIPMSQLEFSPEGVTNTKQEPPTAPKTTPKTEFDVIDYRMQLAVNNTREAQSYVDKNLNSSKAILAKYNNAPPSPSDKPAYLEYRQAFDLYNKSIKVQSDIKEGLYSKEIDNQFLSGVRKSVDLRDADQLRRYAARYNFSNQVKFSKKDGADTIDILGADGKTITSIRANDFDEYLSDPKEFDKIQRKIDEDNTSYVRQVQLKLVESPSDHANAQLRLLSVGKFIYNDKNGDIGPAGFPNVILASEVSTEHGGTATANSPRVQKLKDKGKINQLFQYDNTKVSGQVLGQRGMGAFDIDALIQEFPNADIKVLNGLINSNKGQ
jgi:hypothetical protein